MNLFEVAGIEEDDPHRARGPRRATAGRGAPGVRFRIDVERWLARAAVNQPGPSGASARMGRNLTARCKIGPVSDGSPLPTRRIRLGTILALLVLVTTVPLGLFAASLDLYLLAAAAERSSTGRTSSARARSAARSIRKCRTRSRSFACCRRSNRSRRRISSRSTLGRTNGAILPEWEAVRLLDPRRPQSWWTRRVPFGQRSRARERRLGPAVRQTSSPPCPLLARDPVTGQLYVSVGVPVMRDDRLRYVLGARVPVVGVQRGAAPCSRRRRAASWRSWTPT